MAQSNWQFRFGFWVLATLMLAVVCKPAAADSITFTGSSGTLAASATFEITGGQLVVTLANTSAADVMTPSDVLTAVFFSLPSGVTLTPVSALVASGSQVFFGPSNGGNVGGEWAYASQGASSAGFGIFGSGNFNGPNLQGPPNGAVDGLQYGLTSAGDNLSTGNAAVTGGNALIQNSVVLTLAVTGSLAATDVSNVTFQYGTALTEPSFPGNPTVPEPGTVLLLGSGLAGLSGLGVWRRRKA